jgi:ADP-heptose:LPS heptosyltransferase
MNRLKLLIIRLDGLGDTLLTLPLLAGLKTAWPDCEITYLASGRGAPVFAADSRVDRLWVGEPTEMSRTGKLEWGRQINAAGFDLVFCLNEKFWPAVWTRMSGAKIRLGFDPGWSQPPKALLRRLTLTHRLPAANDPSLPSIHEVERYAALAGLAADGPINFAGPSLLRLPDAAMAEAGALLVEKLPNSPRAIPVALHLSAKWSSEGWGRETCLSAAGSILNRFPDVFLVVTAGPGEDRFFAGAADCLPADRFLLLSDLPFSGWAALLARCKALVTMDTGAVHLAAAVGTPVVDIFPKLNFAHASTRWAPWQVPHRILRRPGPARAELFWPEIHAALEDLL